MPVNVLCPCLFSKHIFRKLTCSYFIIFIFRLSIYSLTSEIPTNRAMLFLMIAFAVLPTISFSEYNVYKGVQARKGSMLLAFGFLVAI
ncbi:hypothetical protein ACSBR1_027628 [Camellia fascicularis]